MFKRLFRRESKQEKQAESPRKAQPESRAARQVEAEKDFRMVRRAGEQREPRTQPDDENLARRERQVAESILENESLTADLDDEAAKQLIDWGIAGAKTVAQSTAGLSDEQAEEVISERMRATRHLMRSVNKLVSKRGEIDAEESAQLLSKISEQAAVIYGQDSLPTEDERRQAFLKRSAEPAQDPARMIADLRGLFEKPDPPKTTHPGGENG